VQADGETGAERGKRSLRRIRRGVVAKQARRLVNDVGRKVADIVGVAELALGHGLAFRGLDDLPFLSVGARQPVSTVF
jgi:hypothetical protein